jgi:16S rRNA (guanine966-N2)-methyltransferase
MVAKGRQRVRVIAGEFKGRLLEYPAAGLLRPTMQRTKSSVFESLGPSIRDSVFVDLYSAAGAMGIEALSRGSALVLFVERHRQALACLRRNLDLCRVAAERYRIHGGDVIAFLEGGHLRSVNPDIVHADPPYADTDFGVLLELLGGIVYPAPVSIIVEHPADLLPGGGNLVRTKVRSFGQTSVSFFIPGGSK